MIHVYLKLRLLHRFGELSDSYLPDAIFFAVILIVAIDDSCIS
jgi:hypothetical protein